MTANRRSLIVLILLFGMTRACKGDGDVELFHSFDATAGHPSGTLIRASDGAFHGTTKSGGMHGRGSVYRIEADRKLVTLHSFDGTNGGAPVAPLFQASNGLLYGSTSEGGQRNLGTLFRLPLTGPVQTLVHFGGWTNGGSPRAGLFQAKDGLLYGTTSSGGENNIGTVFKLTLDGTMTTLVSFHGNDGSRPRAGVVQARELNFLYGTTYSGGKSNRGTVFLCASTGSLITLASFVGTNGANPVSRLVQARDGRFYGVTTYGGLHGLGTVFSIAPDGDLRTVYSFTGGANGGLPVAGLIEGANGELYGTTPYNMDAGRAAVAFKIDEAGAFSVCATLSYSVLYPSSELLAGGDGYLYGVSEVGGTNRLGVVYRILLRPKLEYEILGSNLALSWPRYPAGFHLVQASELESSSSWSVAVGRTVTNESRIQAVVPLGQGKAYFKVHRP